MQAKEMAIAGAVIGGVVLVGLAARAQSRSTSPAATPPPIVAPVSPLPNAEPPAPVGSKYEGKNFRLEFVPEGVCKAKDECRLALKLEATGEYHINREYPYKFKAEAVKGDVTFTGVDKNGVNVFSKPAGDFKQEGETKGTMSIRFKPTAAGDVTIGGTYKLSVCSAQNCQLETQPMQLVVAVAAVGATPPGAPSK